MFQDHDGDCRSSSARLPLHRSEPHSKSTDPLNGKPGPAFHLPPVSSHSNHLGAAIRESGAAYVLLGSTIRSQSIYSLNRQLYIYISSRTYVYICYKFTSILDILIFILHLYLIIVCLAMRDVRSRY